MILHWAQNVFEALGFGIGHIQGISIVGHY
jgi:hypothetical protein